MTLNQIAQQAMDYLDRVGVAADYDIKDDLLTILTEKSCFQYAHFIPLHKFIIDIKSTYPQNPVEVLKNAYKSKGFEVDEDSFNRAIDYLNEKSPA